MRQELLFNRFRPNSVGGKIVRTLASGQPKSVAQLARIAKPKSVDNILAAGGWFDQLRAYGKSSRKFRLTRDGNKLQMVVRKSRAA